MAVHKKASTDIPNADSTQESRRLIVIDDNRAIHDDFNKVLTSENVNDDIIAAEQALFGESSSSVADNETYQLDSAYQGEEGFNLINKALDQGEPYAVAFVDMRMPPGWDGLETIERILEVDHEIQIVICTAYSDYSWNQIVERLGTSDRLLILKKPFDCAEVRQLAAALSQKWTLTRQASLKLEELEAMVNDRTAELRRINEQLRTEISQREQAEGKLRHFALHDPLTNLPNRVLLMDRLGRCCETARRFPDDHTFAVLYLDLDDFKVINDSLGHPMGDRLLIEVANRLEQCVRVIDTTCRPTESTTVRLGGDEFVILLDRIRSLDDAIVVADRVRESLREPFVIDNHEVVTSTSMGIAIGSGADLCPEDIIRDADTALYEAKRNNKQHHAVFDAKMRTQVTERLEIETDLRKAIERDELRAAFQPIINLACGEIIGFEALLRWHRGGGGRVVPPDLFIPIAEETGLIVAIGEWVLREACQQTKAWHDKFEQHNRLSISVNLSPRQYRHGKFIPVLDRVIVDTKIDPSRLNLELTENILMSKDGPTMDLFEQCKQRQVSLHMDDFGTGYSSLSYLHNLPVNAIKLDRSFVQNMDITGEHAATVQAMVTLAHNRGIRMIAEGIETHSQLAQLQALNCEYGQGYYFAKPMYADEAEKMLAEEGTQLKSA